MVGIFFFLYIYNSQFVILRRIRERVVASDRNTVGRGGQYLCGAGAPRALVFCTSIHLFVRFRYHPDDWCVCGVRYERRKQRKDRRTGPKVRKVLRKKKKTDLAE